MGRGGRHVQAAPSLALVPLMYFAGSTRYADRISSVHVMPEFLFAAEYEKPSTEPDARPIMPCRLGPCLFTPP